MRWCNKFRTRLSCAATSKVVAGNAGRHWAVERVVAVGLLGLVPAAVVSPSVVVNYSLAVLVPLHGHWWVVELASFPGPCSLGTRLVVECEN